VARKPALRGGPNRDVTMKVTVPLRRKKQAFLRAQSQDPPQELSKWLRDVIYRELDDPRPAK